MSVDGSWLKNVREKNRSQLGLAGMGASVSEQIAADYARRRTQGPAPAPGGSPPPAPTPAASEVYVQSKLPAYLMVGAAGVLALTLGFLAYRRFAR